MCASAEGVKLEVRELSKKAANNDVILDRVSFEIKAGAVHGLVGPSGSGLSIFPNNIKSSRFLNLCFRHWSNSGQGFVVAMKSPLTTVKCPSAGKTTVLRALNRLWEPSAGTVFYEGVDVTTMDVIALRLRVGMLFQAPALFEGKCSETVIIEGTCGLIKSFKCDNLTHVSVPTSTQQTPELQASLIAWIWCRNGGGQHKLWTEVKGN